MIFFKTIGKSKISQTVSHNVHDKKETLTNMYAQNGMCKDGVHSVNPNCRETLKFEMEKATIRCNGGTSWVGHSRTAEEKNNREHGMVAARQSGWALETLWERALGKIGNGGRGWDNRPRADRSPTWQGWFAGRMGDGKDRRKEATAQGRVRQAKRRKEGTFIGTRHWGLPNVPRPEMSTAFKTTKGWNPRDDFYSLRILQCAIHYHSLRTLCSVNKYCGCRFESAT